MNFLLHLGFSERNDVSLPEKNSVDGSDICEECRTAPVYTVRVVVYMPYNAFRPRWLKGGLMVPTEM